MAPEFNTDIQSKLNSVMGTLRSLPGSTGSTGVSAVNSQFVNSVWGLVQEGQQAIDGNDEQRAQAITQMVTNLLSMVMSLGTQENSKARKEVTNSEKKIDDTDKKAKKTAEETQKKLEEIGTVISNNTTEISQALSEIQKLGGDNGQVAEAQAKLEEQLQIIEEKKLILNDGVSSPEAKEEALNALLMAASTINGLVESVQAIQQEIEAQNNVVINAADNLSDAVEEAANVATDGNANFQSNMQEAGKHVTNNTKMDMDGKIGKKVGEGITELSTTSSIVPVVGQAANAKLAPIGADQTNAGITRQTGAIKNLSKLTESIGRMNTNLSELANNSNAIGGIAESAINLVGQYSDTVNPIIIATGSWTAVAEANLQFEQAIADYSSKTGNDIQTPWGQLGEQASVPTWNPMTMFASQTSQKPQINNEGPKTENNEEDKKDIKFEFDTNIFRQAFGA